MEIVLLNLENEKKVEGTFLLNHQKEKNILKKQKKGMEKEKKVGGIFLFFLVKHPAFLSVQDQRNPEARFCVQEGT